eukprot:XP_011672223.1 PREDICTED: uncharacterized protein LOC105442104 [Strongylocentrotus purpuratus]
MPRAKRRRVDYYVKEFIDKRCDPPWIKEQFINTKKGRGVIAVEDIQHGQFLAQYAGKLLTGDVGRQREECEDSVFRFFFKWHGKAFCIDATEEPTSGPQLGRLVNHGDPCERNSTMKVITVDGSPLLCLFSTRSLTIGTEVLYDYGLTTDEMYMWKKYHSIVTIGRARAVVATIAILSLSLLISVPIPNTPFDDFAIAIENCDPVAIQAISLRLRPLNVFFSLLFIAFLTVTTYTNVRTLVIANRLNVRTRKQFRYLAKASANQATVETETSASVSTAVPMVADIRSEATTKGHSKELSKTSKICRATYLASASANHATVETETSASVLTAVPIVADIGSEAITKSHTKELSKTSKICRATWTVSLITISLYLAWVPQIGMMICQFIPIYPSKPWIFTSTILVHGNMWWTPAIYLGTDRKYRRTAKEMFGKKKLRFSWSS